MSIKASEVYTKMIMQSSKYRIANEHYKPKIGAIQYVKNSLGGGDIGGCGGGGWGICVYGGGLEVILGYTFSD